MGDDITTEHKDPDNGNVNIGAIWAIYARLSTSDVQVPCVTVTIDKPREPEQEREVDVEIIEPLKITHLEKEKNASNV